MRARPGVRIFSGFLFFVTRAASLSQDATQESSGPLLRLCCRGDVQRLRRGRVEDLGPSAMYFVGSRAMNDTVVETRMPARGSTIVGRYAFTHLEGNVVRFAPLYEKYNGGKAMSSHWMKNRNATIFEPPHRKRRGRVSQNYRDELQRRRAKKARRRANQ